LAALTSLDRESHPLQEPKFFTGMSGFRHHYAPLGNLPAHLTTFFHHNKINIPFSNFMFKSSYFGGTVFLVQET
jgi:hypothetical protein